MEEKLKLLKSEKIILIFKLLEVLTRIKELEEQFDKLD
jgi:hypothetical protein